MILLVRVLRASNLLSLLGILSVYRHRGDVLGDSCVLAVRKKIHWEHLSGEYQRRLKAKEEPPDGKNLIIEKGVEKTDCW